MEQDKEKIKRKAQKVVDNLGNVNLATLETSLEIVDKLEDVVETLKGHHQEMMAEKPQEEVQKVQIMGIEMVTIKGEKGEKGDTGEKGEKGEKGIDGKNGKDGKDGKNGLNGLNGIDGIDGKDGKDGLDGKDGSPDTREQIVEKINSGDEESPKISLSQIETFDRISRIELDNAIKQSARMYSGGSGIEVFNSNGKVGSGSALKFIGATVSNDGHLSTITINNPDLSGYVPYTGATTDVNLGSHNLTVDTDTFFVDATNNRLGIGTTTPTYKLDVFGTASADMINSKVGYNITTVTKPDITSMTATPVAGSGLEIGYNYYHITYYNAIGETEASNVVTAITTAGNQQVNLANIPISSDPTVIGRKIYRSKVSESSSYGFNIATIADNTTTTYSDNFPESSMTGDIFSHSIYAKANTTSKFIALNGTRSMVIDANFTSIGVNAGQNITVGAGNTFFGARTGQNVTYGGGNTFFGKYAGQLITTGSDNNFFGNEAGANTGTGVSFSVGIGAGALTYATGSANNAIGYYNGHNTSGGYNNFIGGYTANGSPLSGSNNNGIGHFGMTASTSAHYNNFFGYMALMNLTTGDGNIAIGHQAGDNITTGNKNIIIGYDIDAPSATTDGQMSIGNLIYATGLDGTGTTVSSGNVGIGTTSPVSKLHIGSAPTASANYGLVSLGNGAFDGSTSGFFTGSAYGTGLAMNLASGYAGNLMDLQVGGTSKFKVDNSGIATAEYLKSNGTSQTALFFPNAGAGITWNNNATIKAPAAGVITLGNEGITDFARLQFGGTTSSFPALKRNATGLQPQLADDSGSARWLQGQGADVASASTITLGSGNSFELTGTTAITLITSTGWTEGSIITLIANENVTITNGTATSGADITIKLAGAANFAMTADDTLTLILSSTTAGGVAWREVCRSVN